MGRFFFAFCQHLFLLCCVLGFFLYTLNAQSLLQSKNAVQLFCNNVKSPLGIQDVSPRLSWIPTPHSATSLVENPKVGYSKQVITDSIYAVEVAETLGNLLSGKADCWKTTTPHLWSGVRYQGIPLQSGKTYYWGVRSPGKGTSLESFIGVDSFQVGILQEEHWKGADWIAWDTLPSARRIYPLEHGKGNHSNWFPATPLPVFKKEFFVGKDLRKATAFVAAMGHVDLYLNGKKSGSALLSPGWSDYATRVYAVAQDITNDLHLHRVNQIGLLTGNGFAYIPAVRYRKMTGAWSKPMVRVLLQLEYQDGRVEFIPSDFQWEVKEGPIRFSSVYGGETYDANYASATENLFDVSDAGWRKVIRPTVVSKTTPSSYPPVTVYQKYEARLMGDFPRSGVQVWDAGINSAALPYVECTGKRGDTLRIYTGELLNEAGLVQQKHTGSPTWFEYIFRKEDTVRWRPAFTYSGFRYLQINAPSSVKIFRVEAHAISAEVDTIGYFHSSSTNLNSIFRLIDHAIKSNMQSSFTDCPHREKLGWLEQLYLMGPSLHFRYQVGPILRKMLVDMQDAQTPEGLVPAIVPEYTIFDFANGVFRDSPEWGSASIQVPWLLYQWEQDTSVLKQCYPMMKKYFYYLCGKDSAHLLQYGLGDWYDNGPQKPGFSQRTFEGITATLTQYLNTQTLTKIARILGLKNDAVLFEEKGNLIKKSFLKKWWDEKQQTLANNSQTTLAMALYTGMAGDSSQLLYKKWLALLIKDIQNNKYRLTAGDIGHRYVLKVLEENGQGDLIWQMNNREDIPGYLMQIKKGATALTESWMGLPTVSNNHFMLGHLMEWMFSGILGLKIQQDNPSFTALTLSPSFISDLSFAEGSHRTPMGWVKSFWRRDLPNNQIIWQISTPDALPIKLKLPHNYNIHKVKREGAVGGSEGKELSIFEQPSLANDVEWPGGQYEIILREATALPKRITTYSWKGASEHAGESMPVGGGNIGLNVWVERGDVLIYGGQSGSFDENNALLKAGRLRLRFTPNPFQDSASVYQVLNLEKGHLLIKAGNGPHQVDVKIRVDVFHPVATIDCSSSLPVKLEVRFESWRHQPRTLVRKEHFATSYKFAAPKGLQALPDAFELVPEGLLAYHQNQSLTIFDRTVEQQKLSPIIKDLYNPLEHRISGSMFYWKEGKFLKTDSAIYAQTPFKSWNFSSRIADTAFQFNWIFLTKQYLEQESKQQIAQEANKSILWKKDILHIASSIPKKYSTAEQNRRFQSEKWWTSTFDRSFIQFHSAENGAEHAALFRYMLACNAFSEWPTKFNGGLFTVDPCFTDSTHKGSPDSRNWGGGTHTAQNQRLVYFPMLANGDYEWMEPQIQFYLRLLKNATVRTIFYWGHSGASFTEQLENFGLPNYAEYGVKRPDNYDPGMEYNAWLEYQWDSALEFAWMMILRMKHQNLIKQNELDFAVECLRFFDEHYRYLAKKRGENELDPNGKLIIYPGSAAETFKMALQPASTIAGLRVLASETKKLIVDLYSSNPTESYTSSKDNSPYSSSHKKTNYPNVDTAHLKKTEQYLDSFLVRMPDFPVGIINGRPALIPALSWTRINNTESPQFYALFPWNLYGVGRPNLEWGLQTWRFDSLAIRFRSHVGWKQDNIFAAKLGLRQEAYSLTLKKLASSGRRFPAFWGPGFDWVPDHNWGGTALLGLQHMLLQEVDEKIYLLPAWPLSKEVHFKLFASGNTTVELHWKNNQIVSLSVFPVERMADLVLPMEF